MIIKKFTGKTEAEATEAAKKELGNGLVIMNVREVKKKGLFSFLSPKQIEVTAALEDESPQKSVVNSLNRTEVSGAGAGTAKTVSVKNSTENIEKKLDSLQTLLESQLNSRPVAANTEKAAEAQKEALDSEAEAAVEKQEEKFLLKQAVCKDAEQGNLEQVSTLAVLEPSRKFEAGLFPNYEREIYIRVHVDKGAYCRFSYSLDGKKFTEAGTLFKARQGKWIGAKVGMFSVTPHGKERGWLDVDWFRVEK